MNCLLWKDDVLYVPIVKGGMGFFSLVLGNMFQKLESLLAELLKGCEAWCKIVEATVRYCAKM